MAAQLTALRRPLALAAFLAALGLASVVMVPETSQAVVLRMGQPDRVINPFRPGGHSGAGLDWRIPFAERIVWVDRNLQRFTSENQQVRSADEQVLDLDIDTTYRVFAPVRMVRTVGTQDRLVDQLKAILPALLREELGAQGANAMLAPGAGGATARVRAALDAKARAYGAQVVDLRIAAAKLPEPGMQAALARMQLDREQRASLEQSHGSAETQAIIAEAKVRAAQIYAQSYGQDPQFYDFYRAMKSYEAVFANPANKDGSTIVLSPDSEYLRQFGGK